MKRLLIASALVLPLPFAALPLVSVLVSSHAAAGARELHLTLDTGIDNVAPALEQASSASLGLAIGQAPEPTCAPGPTGTES